MALQLFPLTGGAQQQYDKRLLPDGVLASAVNCEMPRIGRVVGRARYQAIGTGVLSPSAGALVAYDLVTFLERLFVVGDDTRFGVPANLYEYLGSGVAQPWRPTSPVADAVPRLGLATRVRDIARAPDQGPGIESISTAALAGFVALTWVVEGGSETYLSVTRASDDQPVFCALLDRNLFRTHVRVFALSDRFFIVGMNSGGRIAISKFAPATDTAVASVATDVFAAAAGNSWGVCKVSGSDQIVIVARISTSVKVRRFNNAGTVQVPSGGQYADIAGTSSQTVITAVEASSSANQLNVGLVDTGTCGIYSYNLSTGAAIGSGPFDPFTGDTCEAVTIARDSATTVQVVASVSSGTQPEIKANRYTVSTNTFAGKITAMSDAQLTTQALYYAATGALLFGVRVGEGTLGHSPNILASWLLTNVGSRLEIVKDFEVAGVPSVDASDFDLAEFVYDSSSDKYYWCNAAADADGTLAPLVTEFKYGSTDRRQTASYGAHLYLSGGAPMVFDGVSAVESGFQLRPRIISLTAKNGSGQLESGALYHYRCHDEWTDSKGDLHLSPPSAISDVTLGAAHDTVTVLYTSAHSWRRSVGCHPGSAVTSVISRSLATANREPAVLFGATSINPPSSSLNGLTLKLTAGGSSFTVTFSAGATTQATVLSEINAVVSSEVTATAPSGGLVLTTVDTGEGASIQITNGTANTILGFTENDTSTGTTEITTGENFQRADSNTQDVGDAMALYISSDEGRKDESDPILDTDLIRQQVLYSQGIASGAHHAPTPSEFVSAGRDRLVWSGQNKRGRFTATKTIVVGEPAECAADGFLQYSGHITGDIEASFFLGDAMVFWTRRQTWFVTGAGPNRAGQGEFASPQCVNKRIGIKLDGWRSLVEDEAGVWFQGQDSQLYHCSRGGDVQWKGRNVRDYLETYPVITAACARDDRQEIAFGLANATSGATTGGVLRYRADVDAWMFDDVGPVTALVSYQGRLAYIQAGIVYLQDASPGTGTFPTMQLDSGLFQGFQGLGYGQLQELGLLLTYRGPSTITLKIGTTGDSFPDTLATWALTGAEYTVGQRVQLLVDSKQFDYDSFALRLEQSSVAGSTEGSWLHAFALKTEQSPDFVRLASSRRQ